MKKNVLLEEFSEFKILNEGLEMIKGGGTPLSGKVTGHGSYQGRTTMDFALYNHMGEYVDDLCDVPDADFGGKQLAIGTWVKDEF